MAISYSKNMKSLIEDIEVPESEYERAVGRYNAITDYLGQSEVSKFDPEIIIQGSFKMGTAIKPLTEEGSYDIDLVCTFLKLNKGIISQDKLKKMLGNVVVSYANSNGMKSKPKDGKRCWTLSYVDIHNFHLDILPSIPNSKGTEIAITDKRNPGYFQISDEWEISNPKGYFEWFNSISKYEEYRKNYILNESVTTEDVPYYKVKTPLQRVIQILKRHAEVMFDDNHEYKPSSVIITTLAAKAYTQSAGYSDFWELIKDVISKLDLNVEFRDGKPCVTNPIDTNEKLSIKWDLDDLYYVEFKNWIEQLFFDFSVNSSIQNVNEQFSMANRSLHKLTDHNELQTSINSLPYHLQSKWKNNIWKEVHVQATVVQKGFSKKMLHSGQALGKYADIKFEVKAENVNLYDIYWQITNTGYEAQKARQLRGDFYESHVEAGKKIRKEYTCYLGKHYVEAYLVKDNVCVGKSEPFVVNIVNGAFILD